MMERQLRIAGALPVFTYEQMRCLDRLVGEALLSKTLAHRLVILRDDTLAETFGLTTESWNVIQGVEAYTLVGFCTEIMRMQDRSHEVGKSSHA